MIESYIIKTGYNKGQLAYKGCVCKECKKPLPDTLSKEIAENPRECFHCMIIRKNKGAC